MTPNTGSEGAQPRRRPTRRSGLFAYYGGKARLAPWIVENLPAHDGYVEPFCGGARVLFAKPRSKMEVINDLDRGVAATFRIARDHPAALASVLQLTPYSREEHRLALSIAAEGYTVEEIEAARAFLVLSQQQMFAMSRGGMWRQPRPVEGQPQGGWASLPELVWRASERLQGVAVECRPALEVIDYCDHPEVLFYLDPPYHPQACDVKGYRHFMSRDQHRELAETLVHLKGMVVLSGYDHPDYREWFGDWPTLTRETTASTAAAAGSRNFQRTEVLWFNPQAWERRQAAPGAAKSA